MARQTKPSNSNPSKRSTSEVPPSAALLGQEKFASAPTQEQIAARAYEFYLMRGGEHGRDQEDWYHAEAELTLGRQ